MYLPPLRFFQTYLSAAIVNWTASNPDYLPERSAGTFHQSRFTNSIQDGVRFCSFETLENGVGEVS